MLTPRCQGRRHARRNLTQVVPRRRYRPLSGNEVDQIAGAALVDPDPHILVLFEHFDAGGA